MPRLMLSDTSWNFLSRVLHMTGRIYNKHEHRMTLEGILFRLRTGIPWRDLPQEFGHWSKVFRRFNLWSKKGVMDDIFRYLSRLHDTQWLFIDGSIVKVHQDGSNVAAPNSQEIGKSRGGNSTKIHLAVDSGGLPVHFELSGGQTHDVVHAESLISSSPKAEIVIADKGYDSDKLRDFIEAAGSDSKIPRKSNKIALLTIEPASAYGLDIAAGNSGSASNLRNANDFRINIPEAATTGFSLEIHQPLTERLELHTHILYLNAQYKEGLIPDSRMAAFSPFTNADPLRFNTINSGIIVPDSDTGEYQHFFNIYNSILEPNYQLARPGEDLNRDGRGSGYYGVECNEGDSDIVGDGRCQNTLDAIRDIEHPLRDIQGNKIPRSPKWDISLALNYTHAWRTYTLHLTLQAKYRSHYFLTPYNGQGYDPYPFKDSNQTVNDVAPSFYDKFL